ncbi:MAG: TonB-dependent receptor [Ignavibacteriales bacterium]|nr:TonB-dependent receptor [Ignavibacteriales bacterium]MCB9210692.1 TonB-dependent receptor [Ignavibacteriales bacterium]MCB9219653.1 TonB-dependent receptor [Ignavibacteriales bacterium]MCB9259959.1 TonB-dependent receptor [Ignavibacteriales bacterium]
MKFNRIVRLYIPIIILSIYSGLFAGQTGKLSGKIIDRETQEPVIGANIIIQDTYLGAAADLDGYYYINNIPPGEYVVSVTAIGYRKTTVTQVQVRIDLTTNLDVELISEAIDLGQEVVVVADKPLIIKDLTSTKETVSSEDISMMPVEDIGAVVNLQAGVMDGHFRGGRSNEVAYLIDGIPVTDAFNGENSVEIENGSVRELEVISGTFNAEYGQAMSGVVNIVTKEGSQKYEGSVSAYFGNYITPDDGIYQNLGNFNFDGVKDITFSLSGPTKILDDLTFFFTGRYFDDGGHTFGKRVYNIEDSFPFMPTGDGEFVAMDPWKKMSANAKLTYNMPSWKFSYSFFGDTDERSYYDHDYRWTPDGIMNHFNDNMIHNLQISIIPSQSTFSSLKFSANFHNFEGYLFEDPYDSRYGYPSQGQAQSDYTYRTGGTNGDRYERNTNTLIGQWTLESQVSKQHKVKVGLEGRMHKVKNHWRTIRNLVEGQLDENGNPLFELGYSAAHTEYNNSYEKTPFEFNGYIQDKMEYDIMIINAGLRLDYFNANDYMISDLKNPLNNSAFPGYNDSVKVDAKYQLSPRLGVSFPMSDQGAIYFSYGHFFQIPPLENLYYNDENLINQGAALSSRTGNPDLKAQKTIQYEVGLQQVLFPNIALDFSVYYRDIRNLLGVEIINTYEGFKYGRYINKDYGNTKGFILTLDKRYADYFSAKIDYTYQIAEGNASDPLAVYNDNQSDPPVESEKHLVPLDWDQTSTINLTGTVGVPGDWTVGLIFQYGSGTPYTEDIRISNGVRFENGGRKPFFFNTDLKADKFFDIAGINFHAYLLVYNLFDIRNEYGVYSTTGRANSDLNVKFAGEVFGLNTIDEFLKNPGMYSAPRQIRVGLSLGF